MWKCFKFSKAEMWTTYSSTSSEVFNILLSNHREENTCTYHKKRGGNNNLTACQKKMLALMKTCTCIINTVWNADT